MDYIYIGDLVNTHGIRGEVRIISDFELKTQVFKKGVKLYIGRNKEEVIIKSYRFHKIFDMVTFLDIEDINDVLGYKGERVYVDRSMLKIKTYLKQDLIGMEACTTDRVIGKVKQIMNSKAHDILVISGETKNHLVPYNKAFIANVDVVAKKILINEIEGLFNEN